jgi:hypothetical protein
MYILSNKSYNFFFFKFFNSTIKRKNVKKYINADVFNDIVNRVDSRLRFLKVVKSIKKTFKFTDYFFSKIFFVSFYKFIIISVKIYARFHKFKKFRRNKVIKLFGLL